MTRGFPGGMVNRSIAATAFVAMTILCSVVARAATVITVNSLDDPRGAGSCTLRDAITLALGGSIAPDKCKTKGNLFPYTIVFEQTGVISLASTLPPITRPILTIVGPATSPGITIDGRGMVQLFEVQRHGRLNLQNLTLSHGNAGIGEFGGAINNQGTLNVADSTFFANRASYGGGAVINHVGAALTVFRLQELSSAML
jgi:CSLREA domain-containing protein